MPTPDHLPVPGQRTHGIAPASNPVAVAVPETDSTVAVADPLPATITVRVRDLARSWWSMPAPRWLCVLADGLMTAVLLAVLGNVVVRIWTF